MNRISRMFIVTLAGLLASVGSTAQAGLIDVVAGAQAAYSLRKLNDGYSGNAIEVRRASDNTTANIGFDANGQLDWAALATFVGNGNAFVTTWYDQSGIGRHATQTTTGRQPQIVAGGALITDPVNGLPALRFNGSKALNYAGNLINETMSVFSAAAWFSWTNPTSDNSSLARRLWTMHASGATRAAVGGQSARFGLGYRASGSFVPPITTTNIDADQPFVASYLYDVPTGTANDSVRLRLDGTQIFQETGLNLDLDNVDNFTIGSQDQTTRYFDGLIQEMIVYHSVLSGASLALVEGNMMNVYIPEPSSLVLLAFAGVMLLARRRRNAGR